MALTLFGSLRDPQKEICYLADSFHSSARLTGVRRQAEGLRVRLRRTAENQWGFAEGRCYVG